RGLLGLSVTCARCHDHKFDPVPQRDYYSLYGVFASAEEPKELPLIGAGEDGPERRAFEAELKKREAAVAEFREANKADLQARNGGGRGEAQGAGEGGGGVEGAPAGRPAEGDGPGRPVGAGRAGGLPPRQPEQPRRGGAAAVPRGAGAGPQAVHAEQRSAGAG